MADIHGRQIISTNKGDLGAVACLVAMSLILALSYLIPGDTILKLVNDPDNFGEWILYRKFIADSFASGHFPLWTPHLYCGFPFAGWAHASSYAPTSFIYFLWDYPVAALIGYAFHLAIFTVSLYGLLRVLAVSTTGALIAAIVSGFGFFSNYESTHYLPRLLTLSWSPLFFMMVVLLLRSGRILYLLAGALVLCAQLLSGHMDTVGRQIMVLALAAGGLMIAYRLPVWLRVKAFARSGAMIALGGLMAGVLVLPLFELVVFSIRGGEHAYWHFAMPSSLPSISTGLFLFTASFMTIVMLLGVALGLMVREPKFRAALFVVVACLMIATNSLGVLKLLYYMPLVNRLFRHATMINLAVIPMALIVGWSWDHLFSTWRSDKIGLLLGLGAAGMGLFYFLLLYLHAAGALPGYFQRLIYWHAGVGAVLIPAGIFLAAYARRKLGPKALAGLFFIVIFFDVYLPNFTVLDRNPADKDISAVPGYRNFFNEQPNPPDRSINIMPLHFQNSTAIPFQAGVLDRTQTFDGYITVVVSRYADVLKLIKPMPDDKPKRKRRAPSAKGLYAFKIGGYFNQETLPLLNLLNLGYVCTYFHNLKYSSHHHLAYFLDPPKDISGVSAFQKRLLQSYPGPTVEAPINWQWKNRVFITRGDVLEFGLSSSSNDLRAASYPNYLIELSGPEGGSNVLFSHTPSQKNRPGLSKKLFQIDLSPWSGKTVDLTLVITSPDADASSGAAAGFGWIDPTIKNPSKYFQRVEVEGAEIYRNTGVFPRAFMAHKYRLLPRAADRLSALASADFEHGREIILEAAPDPEPVIAGRQKQGLVKFTDYGPDHIELSAISSLPGLLFMSDTYFPGWRAEVDGSPARILRADHSFRAVALGAGRHNVKFQYVPVPFRIGLFVTLTCMMTLLPVLIIIGGRSFLWRGHNSIKVDLKGGDR